MGVHGGGAEQDNAVKHYAEDAAANHHSDSARNFSFHKFVRTFTFLTNITNAREFIVCLHVFVVYVK